jgi:hypothetical protein
MTDIDPDTLDVLESVLRDSHVGESNAVTSDELATALDESDRHDTNPSIRDAVRQLVNDRQVPVCSSTRGYWIPEDAGGIDDEIESIRDRIGALNTRIINLRAARDEFDFDRATVAEDDDEQTETGTTADSDTDTEETTVPDDDGDDCEKCGDRIAGDSWQWYDYDLCRECYDRKPPSSEAFHEWIDSEGQQTVADGGESR